jgi:hypothetical protein
MRGTKAKMLRRSVYGDQSIRAARQYIGVSVLRVVTPRGEFTRVTRINAPKSLRAQYLTAKKDYKACPFGFNLETQC